MALDVISAFKRFYQMGAQRSCQTHFKSHHPFVLCNFENRALHSYRASKPPIPKMEFHNTIPHISDTYTHTLCDDKDHTTDSLLILNVMKLFVRRSDKILYKI